MDQNQKSGNNSTNLQAKNITFNNNNLSYEQVQDIALKVFKANFYDLIGIAKDIARARAEEITEKFLEKLHNEFPIGFQQANSPDFQNALFTVQKEYAKCGDEQLGDLLVDLLVDRSKQSNRDILQIVLNESMLTAPKLTIEQISVLSVIFLFRYTKDFSIGDYSNLGLYFDDYLKSNINYLVKNRSCYQHLEYTGCGNISLNPKLLETIISTSYHGLFLKGFTIEKLLQQNITKGLDSKYVISCLNDTSKYQIGFNSHQLLDESFDTFSINKDDREKIKMLFDINKMNSEEVKNKCIETRIYMKNVFDIWNDSPMKNFTLTSVGMAIGHANIKRLKGEFAQLSIWIN